MVGGPAWQQGADLLRDIGPGTDIGLHLDMTEFSLLPGSRRSLHGLMALSLSGKLPWPDVRLEIRAQLDAFEDALGRPPDFIDGHQHVHQLPIVRDEMLDEVAARYGLRRPWLRSTRPRPAGTRLGTRLKAAVIEALGARTFRKEAQSMGFRHNDGLLGVYDFRGGPARYQALLANWLKAAGPGDLLMCHPGTGRHADDVLDGARQSEYAVLRSPWMADLLDRNRLVLRPMSDILRHEGLTLPER
jgi:predicted glycoside hydrolase/deacetylase ChbG (UPF0249 family)